MRVDGSAYLLAGRRPGSPFHLPQGLKAFRLNHYVEPILTRAPSSVHPDRGAGRETHPLRGLLGFGPYSKGLSDPIRVATIAPAGESARLYGFLRELGTRVKPRERKDYLPEWPGFRTDYNLGLREAGKGCHIELDPALEHELANASRPHVLLADRLVRNVQLLDARRADFDVLFIYLPRRWKRSYIGGSGEDFDLHDHIKATTALRRMPVQLVREGRALSYVSRQRDVADRIGSLCERGRCAVKIERYRP